MGFAVDHSSDLRGSETSGPYSRIPEFAALAIIDGSGASSSGPTEEEEILRASATDGRKESFRLGRRAAHEALRSLGLDHGPILKGQGGEPIWPEGAVGSITNKPSAAAALVARSDAASGVGVDLEFLQPTGEIEAVVLRPEESTWVSGLDRGERDQAVVAVFAAKEAIFKALYPLVGRRFGFDAVAVDLRCQGFEARLVDDLHPVFSRDTRLAVAVHWYEACVLAWLILPRATDRGEPHRALNEAARPTARP